MDHTVWLMRVPTMNNQLPRPRLLARFGLVLVVAAALCALLLPAASSQSVAVTVSPNPAQPGETITVAGAACPDAASGITGTNFTGVSNLRLTTNGSTTTYATGEAAAAADGTWTLSMTVPADAPAGDYDVTQSCRFTNDSGLTTTLGQASATVTIEPPADAPTMSVTPITGVRPLTITVSGSQCAVGSTVAVNATLNTDASVVEAASVPGTGDDWSTTLTLDADHVGNNTVSAVCVDGTGGTAHTYPNVSVAVTTPAPALTASPQTSVVGDTITATADRCPDPELPQIGGDYRVQFTLTYTGADGQIDNVVVNGASTSTSGTAEATFVLPDNAPAGTYEVSAVCQLSELSPFNDQFTYTPVVLSVTTDTTEPTATATVAPTATATATTEATVAPSPTAAQATAVPGISTNNSQASATPTSIPRPAATATPAPAGDRPGIDFTG